MSWSEADSEHFIDEGKYFVPERELQIEIICGLIPPGPDDALLVELCCGEGLLTHALLTQFAEERSNAVVGIQTQIDGSKIEIGETSQKEIKTNRTELEESFDIVV